MYNLFVGFLDGALEDRTPQEKTHKYKSLLNTISKKATTQNVAN